MSNVSTSVTTSSFWTESTGFDPEQGTVERRVRFSDFNRSVLVEGAPFHPARLLPQYAAWCASIPKIAIALLEEEEASGLPQWAVSALQGLASFAPSPCEITVEGEGITGAFSLPCDWGAVMGDCEDSLEEQGRLGHLVEQKTGLRVRFSQFDWTTSSATFYVASR
jgi:hypothetical protein